MTLGQKIAALRGKMNYSQGDLAEKLNISRQSISKWETDASTPELGKLIQLCDLFQISLDDLVRQDEIPVSKDQTEERMEKVEAAAEPKSMQTQKLVGVSLLSVGLLCSALAFGLGSGLLVIGGYIAFCGILCLIMKKHAGVTIGWITLAQAVILTPFFTGVRVFAVFSPSYYSRGISVNHIITIGIWILFFVLAGLSFRAIGGRKKNKCAQEKENRCNPAEKDV